MQKIKIYAFTKGKHLILFITAFNTLPYVAEASDIHRENTFDEKSHPMYETLRKLPEKLPDSATHLALLYNGLAWEISGVANKEKENTAKQANSGEKLILMLFFFRENNYDFVFQTRNLVQLRFFILVKMAQKRLPR